MRPRRAGWEVPNAELVTLFGLASSSDIPSSHGPDGGLNISEGMARARHDTHSA